MQLTHLALAVLVTMIWGFNYVVIKVGLQQIPPLLLCGARFFLTSIPAIFFIKFPASSFKKVAAYGLVMFALQFAFLFAGIKLGVAPGLASLLVQVQVFFSAILAAFFSGESIRRWQVLGGLVSFAGISIIGFKVEGQLTLSGMLLILGSALTWAVGNIISKKIGKVNMLSLVVWGCFISCPAIFLASYLLEGPPLALINFSQLSWLSIGSILYITYFSTLVGFVTWNWLIHHHSLAKITPFTMLVPVFAMTSTTLVLGEPVYSWQLFAAVLIISGLLINLMGSRLFKSPNSPVV